MRLSLGLLREFEFFNFSFELASKSTMLRQYLSSDELRANALFIIAAGNNGAINKGANLDTSSLNGSFRKGDVLTTGGPLPDVIFVAALDEHGKLAGFSNYGNKTVEIAAPGSNISSTIRNNGYGLLSGTSQAAPFVTLTAAILLAEFPSLSLPEIHHRIVDTCDWVPEFKPFIHDGCKLNIQKAITSNVDLLELKSGLLLKGTVAPAQISIPDSSQGANGSKYERAWFGDDGQLIIVTTNGRFTKPVSGMQSIMIKMTQPADCAFQVTGDMCAIPVSMIRDIIFRVSGM